MLSSLSRGRSLLLWICTATAVLVGAAVGISLSHAQNYGAIAVVENMLLATLTVVVVAEASMLDARLRTVRRLVFACSAYLLCATALWEIDRLNGSPIEPHFGDLAAVIGWLIAGYALQFGIRRGAVVGVERRILVAVFCIHTLSVLTDLTDAGITQFGMPAPMVAGLCETLEIAFMSGYAFTLGSMVWAAGRMRAARAEVVQPPVRIPASMPVAGDPAPPTGEAVAASVPNAALLDRAPGERADAAEAGRARFEALRSFGIEPHHCVIDFGCGPLKVGVHFIHYLLPRRYVGLDINEALLRSGFNRLPPGLVEARRPYLAVITEPRLRKLRRAEADWIVCTSVIMHVPPRHLARLFDRLCGLAVARTRLVLTFDCAAEIQQTGPLSWAYPEELLVRELRRRLPGRPIAIREFEAVDPIDGRPWSRARVFVGLPTRTR